MNSLFSLDRSLYFQLNYYMTADSEFVDSRTTVAFDIALLETALTDSPVAGPLGDYTLVTSFTGAVQRLQLSLMLFMSTQISSRDTEALTAVLQTEWETTITGRWSKLCLCITTDMKVKSWFDLGGLFYK